MPDVLGYILGFVVATWNEIRTFLRHLSTESILLIIIAWLLFRMYAHLHDMVMHLQDIRYYAIDVRDKVCPESEGKHRMTLDELKEAAKSFTEWSKGNEETNENSNSAL